MRLSSTSFPVIQDQLRASFHSADVSSTVHRIQWAQEHLVKFSKKIKTWELISMTVEFNRSVIYSTDDSNWASAEITFVSEIYSIPTPQSRDNSRWISHSSSRIFSFFFSPLQCFLPPRPSQSSEYSIITSLWPCLSHLRSIHQIA